MSDLNSKHNRFRTKKATFDEKTAPLDESRDCLAEELLKNINTTPIGRLLKEIAQMPEIRHDKVATLRNQLNRGEYNLNERLDLALDKVLEELIM